MSHVALVSPPCDSDLAVEMRYREVSQECMIPGSHAVAPAPPLSSWRRATHRYFRRLRKQMRSRAPRGVRLLVCPPPGRQPTDVVLPDRSPNSLPLAALRQPPRRSVVPHLTPPPIRRVSPPGPSSQATCLFSPLPDTPLYFGVGSAESI